MTPQQPPAGWVSMPSIASQVETDPVKQQQHALLNKIRAPQGQQAPQQPQQPPMPNVGPQTPPPAAPAPLQSQAGSQLNLPQLPGSPKPPLKIASIIHLDSHKQETNYSCGPAALKTILDHFNKPTSETTLRKETNSTKEDGTDPEKIISAAKKKGLSVIAKENMTTEELKSYLKEKKPVILAIQSADKTSNTSGHYIVAVGHKNNELYFEDPADKEEKINRMPFDELNKRWHDKCKDKILKHYGIVIWKEGK